jgi:hypothetical protein
MLEIHQLRKIMTAMPTDRQKLFNLDEIDAMLLAIWPEVELAASVEAPSLIPFSQWGARISWARAYAICEILCANDALGASQEAQDSMLHMSFISENDSQDDRLVKGVALYQFVKVAQAAHIVSPLCLATVSAIMIKYGYAAQYYSLKTGFVH